MATEATDPTLKWMRRIARALGLLIIGVALVVLVGHLVAPEPVEEDYPPIENRSGETALSQTLANQPCAGSCL